MTTFSRDYGATAGDAKVVAVRTNRTAFDGEDKSAYVLVPEGDARVTAAWESHDVLRIRRSASKCVFLEIHLFKGTQTRYNDAPL